VFAGKPIIGIAGGIGSGKSFIAHLFAREGCLVLSADERRKSMLICVSGCSSDQLVLER